MRVNTRIAIIYYKYPHIMKKINVLPIKYRDSVTLEQHIKNAEKEYQKGNFIEAFVILYSQTEFELNMLWSSFVILSRRSKTAEIKEKEYGELVDLLYEFGIINEGLRCSLLELKKGRNNAVHYLLKSHKVKINKKTLDSQFKGGLKAYMQIFNKEGELSHEIYLKISKKEAEGLESKHKEDP